MADADATESGQDGAHDALIKLVEEVVALKEAGNEALKSKDLPLATQHYDDAVTLWEKALAEVPQNQPLPQNEVVRYSEHGFGVIETADPVFKDYAIEDLCTANIVKHKIGQYEEVITKFKRKDIAVVPLELFEIRLACLQNRALVALKMARASRTQADWEDVVRRADLAIAMNGNAAKALMRKGEALVELKDNEGAMRALAMAARETGGRDEEVNRLLEQVIEAKGKGKGKGRGRGRGGGSFKSRFAEEVRQEKREQKGVDSESESSSESEPEPVREERAPERKGLRQGRLEAERSAPPPSDSDPDDFGEIPSRSRRRSAEDEALEREAEAMEALRTRSTPSSARASPVAGRCTKRRLAIAAGVVVLLLGGLGNAALLMRPRGEGTAAEL